MYIYSFPFNNDSFHPYADIYPGYGTNGYLLIYVFINTQISMYILKNNNYL